MKVKAKRHFSHKGKDHKPGDVLDVPDHEATQLQQAGNVEPAGVAPEAGAHDAGVEGSKPQASGAQAAAPPHKDKPQT